MWFLLILCLGLHLSLAINLMCLHRLFCNIYIVVVRECSQIDFGTPNVNLTYGGEGGGFNP